MVETNCSDCNCPKCGESERDRLAWLDDDRVRCESCGEIYCPHN